MIRTNQRLAMALGWSCAALLSAATANAETAPFNLAPSATDTILEPQLISITSDLTEDAQLSVVGAVAQPSGTRYAGFATRTAAISQTLFNHAAFNVSLAPGIEILADPASPTADVYGTVVPLQWSVGVESWSWSSELAYHAFVDASEWTLESGVSLNVTPSWSLSVDGAMAAQPDFGGAQLWFNGSLSYQPSAAWSLQSSFGRGVRDTPFDADETLGVMSASWLL